MPHRTFLAFILPSLIAMLVFIALPVVSVGVQSLYVEHDKVLVQVDNCGPFGCQQELRIDGEATAQLQAREPLGQFNGLGTYANRSHLALTEIGEILGANSGWRDIAARIYDLQFYKALAFTLVYTFAVTPLALVLGFVIALAVNALPGLLKGPVIFFSLLPMIVTPLVGSLILFWMLNSQGILGAMFQSLTGDRGLYLEASPVLTWITLLIYGVWTNAPFSFVVFYAGLQTVSQETLEAATIDGANRWQRVRHVIIPAIAPLATFAVLVQLMDNFRVFEPIAGFSAQANATSLSWSIFNDLHGQASPLFGSAAATSMLTILGVAILLSPVVVRTWREFNLK